MNVKFFLLEQDLDRLADALDELELALAIVLEERDRFRVLCRRDDY